uniref:Uncharacterized protein n=1 Tax=Avena sativa TaxID=4498 RepID=A0ACD5YAV4_AVESA
MAEDDDGVLPAYIEEDDEEAAAAKQQRREQSKRKKPRERMPWEFATPEEAAKAEARHALERELIVHDPKTGDCCFTRVWFLDLTIFDLDEGTQYGPMRYVDSAISDDHRLLGSLNVHCLKIISSDIGYPINVYGTVIVRDDLDYKCVNIFRRDRNNCQLVQSEKEDLILTGPTRGVVFRGGAIFEVNLMIKEEEECNDGQFSKVLIDVLLGRIMSKVGSMSRSIPSWLSEVELVYSHVKKALESTVEIKILSGPEVFDGKITACTTDVPDSFLLYDGGVGGDMASGDGGIVQLLRRVVAVSVDEMLMLNIYACGGDRNGNVSSTVTEFAPGLKGRDGNEIVCGLYEMLVKVVWSVLF